MKARTSRNIGLVCLVVYATFNLSSCVLASKSEILQRVKTAMPYLEGIEADRFASSALSCIVASFKLVDAPSIDRLLAGENSLSDYSLGSTWRQFSSFDEFVDGLQIIGEPHIQSRVGRTRWYSKPCIKKSTFRSKFFIPKPSLFLIRGLEGKFYFSEKMIFTNFFIWPKEYSKCQFHMLKVAKHGSLAIYLKHPRHISIIF